MHVPAQLAVALRKWNAGTGGAALDKVSDELSSAAQSGGIKLFSPMKLACSSLAAAVVAAKASPLIPDAVTQKWYAAALAQLASAAAVCQSAISVQGAGENVQTEENPALLHRSESELAAGPRIFTMSPFSLRPPIISDTRRREAWLLRSWPGLRTAARATNTAAFVSQPS